MKTKREMPPPEFAAYIQTLDAAKKLSDGFDMRSYTLSPEWGAWKAGYNACAERHNKRVAERYSINNVAARVFGGGK